MMNRWSQCIAAVAVTVLLSGCFMHDNNYLQPDDFVRAMRKEGLKIERVNRLDPRPLGATEALEARVAGSGIGIYKFDRTAKVTSDRLEKIRKSKKIYFNGIPYPVYEVCGSFFVIGLDKNPEKHKILEVLRSFR